MPRYFFNVYDGASDLDDTGTELPDAYAAQTEALVLSGQVLHDMGAAFWDGTTWRLEVADASGRVLFVLTFAAAAGAVDAASR